MRWGILVEVKVEESLLEKLARRSLSSIVADMLRHPDKNYEFMMAQELERLKIAYEITPPRTFSSSIILGTYKLLLDKYKHNFGKEYDNVLHSRIKRDLKDYEFFSKFKNGKHLIG